MVIRRSVMKPDFAAKFHGAINRQIELGKPPDLEEYRKRLDKLYEFAADDKIDSLLEAKTLLF